MAFLQATIYSDALQMQTHLNVLLPERRNFYMEKLSNEEGKCPVLFLLHGLSDCCDAWMRYTAIERYVRQYELAVVMPEVQRSFYTDMRHGEKYWTYLSQELMDKCCELFPQISPKREDHYAAGLSMGGYGAMKLALGAPDRFCFAASLSGAMDVATDFATRRENDQLFMDIFGTPAETRGSDNDLFALAQKLADSGKPLPELYMWCGTEDFLYKYNTELRGHLQKLGYPLTFEESRGDHMWKYWDLKIPDVLEKIVTGRGGKFIRY